MEINKIIKKRRIELGLTLKDISQALNIAESTVSRYESSDIQNMGIDKIEALSKVLQCSPAFLMGWEIEDPNGSLSSLSKKEEQLVSDFRKLNSQGQNYILQTMDMVKDKYKKCDTFSELERLG